MKKTQAKFKSGQEIVTKVGVRYPGEKSKGKVAGYVGASNEMCVRVQWQDDDIRDYSEEKLASMID